MFNPILLLNYTHPSELLEGENMIKQYYELVVISTFPYVADESLVETFKRLFQSCKRTKRVYKTKANSLTFFSVEAKEINPKSIKKFEDFLKTNGFTKLYSVVTSDIYNEVDARFFTFRLNPKHFQDMKELLISKIEKAIGKKVKVYEDVYYFHLTKSQAMSKALPNLLDELLDPSLVNIVSYV